MEEELTSGYTAMLTFKKDMVKMGSLKSKIKTLQSKYDDLYSKNVELNKKMYAVLK